MKNLIALLLLIGCTQYPDVQDAIDIINENGGFPDGVSVRLDDETTVIYINGQKSGQLGKCELFPDGQREVTIYVARHWEREQLKETILHELNHALKTCSNEDHSENKTEQNSK
jgi:hypothetical protein